MWACATPHSDTKKKGLISNLTSTRSVKKLCERPSSSKPNRSNGGENNGSCWFWLKCRNHWKLSERTKRNVHSHKDMLNGVQPERISSFRNILYYLFEKKLKLKRWYYHFIVTLNHPIKTRTSSHANCTVTFTIYSHMSLRYVCNELYFRGLEPFLVMQCLFDQKKKSHMSLVDPKSFAIFCVSCVDRIYVLESYLHHLARFSSRVA